ncbi:MAG: hypothetical protein AB7S38_23235 [Vulcanimicrobiota bacterium]
MQDQLPIELPPEAADAYAKFLERPLLSREALAQMVEAHHLRLRAALPLHPRIDTVLAKDLTEGLKRMLGQAPGPMLIHAQAAAYYFVESDDADPDLESMLGLDDDALVFNAVCLHLGRPDWQVEL